MNKGNKNKLQRETPQTVPMTTPSVSGWTWAGICVLVLLTAAIYLPAMRGGELLDDDLLLTRNEIVRSPSGLYQFWCTGKPSDYWPVTNSTFWLEWRLWGEHLTGYHVTNLALHIIESLLIWFLLRKLKIPGAFWGGLLFAVHPVNVESVAWIASRKNLVAMLFLLLSLWWYLNAEMRLLSKEEARPKGNGERPAGIWAQATAFSSDEFSGVWYWLSFAAFVLAALGKGSAVVLPGLLLCILWWKRPLAWRDLRRMLPFLAAGVALAVVNVLFQTHDTEEIIRNVDFVDHLHVDFTERLLGAGGVVWFYLYKAIWPFSLAFIYPSWNIDADAWQWWLPLCGAVLVTAALFVAAKPWRRTRNRFAPFWFAWIFFGIALLPVMGFSDVGFMKYTLVADRYLHVALLAVVALAAAAIGTACVKLPESRRWPPIAAAITIVAVFSFFSWRQSGLYLDRFTLFQAAEEKNPNCWMIQHTLGYWELTHGRPQESVAYFLKALDLYRRENSDRALIHDSYANALFALGRSAEGVEELEAAFTAGRRTRAIIERLRRAYREAKEIDKLLDFDARLITLFPQNPAYHNNYGTTLMEAGQLPAAAEQFLQAINLDRQDAEAFNNLGVACLHLGKVDQAVACYEQALHCKPDYAEAHYNFAGLLYRADKIPEAIAQAEAAVKIKPDYFKAHFLLAKCYHVAHQDAKALAAAKLALEEARSKKQDRLAADIEKWLQAVREGKE